MSKINYQALAVARVNVSQKLFEYKDIILYDWPEGESHWQWVVTATEEEILTWAMDISDVEKEN